LDHEKYSLFEMVIPRVNSSVLYQLPPLGIESADVESLTSYITRLANAHNVNVRVLLKHVIKPHLTNYSKHSANNYNGSAYRVNGNGNFAKETVRIIEILTKNKNLSSLTFVSLGDLISQVNLLKHQKSWCPYCYADMRKSGIQEYDKLIWALADYQYCSKHNRKLVERCPFCKAVQIELGRFSRISYCQKCFAWLGNNYFEDSLDLEKGKEEDSRQQIVSTNLMDFIVGISLNGYSRKNLSLSLKVIKENAFLSPIDSFCRDQLGMNLNAYTAYIKMTKKPILKSLIRISLMFNISIKNLLLNEVVLNSKVKSVSLPVTEKKKFKEMDFEKVQKYLEEQLKNDDITPLHNIASNLECSYMSLKKHFPELYLKVRFKNQMQRKRKSEELQISRVKIMRQVVRDLKKKGIKPTYRVVQQCLPYSFVSANKELMDTWREECLMDEKFKNSVSLD
jgi:hypothetical protein